MAIYGYTKNYKLIKPQFDADTWHDYVYDNLDTIDAVMSGIYKSGNWQGFWKNNTKYDVNAVVIDKNTDTMYTVLVEHTTDDLSSFEEFRQNNPTYYTLWAPNELAKEWAINTEGTISGFDDYSAKAYAVSEGLIPEGSAKELRNETQQIMQDTADQAASDIAIMSGKVTEATNQANASALSASAAKTSETNSKASETAAAQSASEASTSASEASASAQAAAASATDANDAAQRAANSNISATDKANLAQSWAIGDISTRPEGSAKYWAETAEQKAGLNTIRTNCITSAPQNIKLELNNGTLTLKAGSKVYDGNGLFKSIDADVSVNTTGFYFPCCLFIQKNGTFGAAVTSEMRSGDTLPSSGNVLFYNTTDKKCYRIINGSVSYQTSFPICILQSAASIDRVFNELGYIGNTMFSLQSLKGLMPNGRNADGSLNNIEFETAGVLTHTATSGYDGYIVLNGTILSGWNVNNSRYDFENNINLYNGVKNNVSIVGTVSTNSTGRITSFNPKLPFQAVDASDYRYLAGIDSNIDYIIESARNGKSWYAKYRSGRLEQGGNLTSSTPVVFLKPFKNTNYQIVLGQSGSTSSSLVGRTTWNNKTTTGFTPSFITETDWFATGEGA